MSSKYSCISFVLLLIAIHMCLSCEPDQTRQGCRIQEGRCLCGIGCYSEYRYSSKEECRKALNGQKRDICQRNPCLNGGSCSQTSYDPGFRCRCEGSGYYGDRCQNACPTTGASQQSGESFPYECVII